MNSVSYIKKPVLGYLSAAPRVSTRTDAELGGARTHVLGIMHAFEALNWEVKPFIVGDRLTDYWSKPGSEHMIRNSRLRVLLADFLRIGIGIIGARYAWRELGPQVDWVYERAAALQSLGDTFKRHGIPWILETNAPLFYEAKQERKTLALYSLARRLEIRAYKACDVLVCITEALKEIVVQEADIPPEKVIVMPNGVDVDFFNPACYEPRRVFDGFTLGFVGSLYPWQRLDLLLDTLYSLNQEGVCVHLVVIGDGVARMDLEHKTISLSLSNQVKFLGQLPRNEVPFYTAAFDIGYSGQTPLSNGVMYLSPLKLYEYMAMAKPVIASDFADARNLIREGQTGYLFRVEDENSLREKLLEAYKNRQRLADMGREAREEIVRHHSWVSRVSDLIRIVQGRGKG